MKNTLTDLNNHLFAQIERLSDEEVRGDELAQEIGRAKAVSDIAAQIISTGGLALKAKVFADERYCSDGSNIEKKLPPMLRASLKESLLGD